MFNNSKFGSKFFEILFRIFWQKLSFFAPAHFLIKIAHFWELSVLKWNSPFWSKMTFLWKLLIFCETQYCSRFWPLAFNQWDFKFWKILIFYLHDSLLWLISQYFEPILAFLWIPKDWFIIISNYTTKL